MAQRSRAVVLILVEVIARVFSVAQCVSTVGMRWWKWLARYVRFVVDYALVVRLTNLYSTGYNRLVGSSRMTRRKSIELDDKPLSKEHHIQHRKSGQFMRRRNGQVVLEPLMTDDKPCELLYIHT